MDKHLNMVSVVVNSGRGEAGCNTYMLREDLLPYLLSQIPEHLLMQYAEYAEYETSAPFMVKVLKNRMRGEGYRESIADLTAGGELI
tara:strand:- start:718 stop:978 length:261 start_codon:yes stop_codon:yes gene_type:complete